MKIAINARFYRKPTGGIGRYTRNLIRELVNVDYNNNFKVWSLGA